MTTTSSCRRCGAALGRAARFCGRCGAATPEANRDLRAHRSAERRELVRSQRVAHAVAVLFGGVILGLVASYAVGGGEWTLASEAVMLAADLLAGGAALRLLGAGAARDSLPLPAAPRWLLLAPVAGVGAYVVAWAYVSLLALLADADMEWSPSAVEVVSIVVVAPLVEEWLCRGVLWTALSRVATPGRTIVHTALLFAVMHGLQGALGLPHRFVAGLLFGWLRRRSGSLLPGIVAHATVNVLAVVL